LSIAALIPAAGKGARMGETVNKLLIPLMGVPLIIRTLRIFEYHQGVDAALLAVPAEEVDFFLELVHSHRLSKVTQIVAGGRDRQESVYHLLKVSAPYDLVAIHDGARPFLTGDALSSVLVIPDGCDGVVLGTPLKDTIKRIDSEGIIIDTPTRSEYCAVQTPQVFLRSRLLEAHERALREGLRGTDDSSLLERYGGIIRIVQGSYDNIKITTKEDILIGEAILRKHAEEVL